MPRTRRETFEDAYARAWRASINAGKAARGKEPEGARPAAAPPGAEVTILMEAARRGHTYCDGALAAVARVPMKRLQARVADLIAAGLLARGPGRRIDITEAGRKALAGRRRP